MQRLEWIQNKVTSRDALYKHCNSWRTFGKKIVFTNGCFDILHRGHLDYLARAADFGNILIVGVNSDASVKKLKGEGRPVTNQEDRIFQLASLLCVDTVCLFEEDTPEELIKIVKPDVLVKGGDYTIDTIVGADYVIENGGRVEIIPFVAGYSTTGLIANIKEL
jgi:rfaE bifunctional protein nucleotidyltransferase chain/domain